MWQIWNISMYIYIVSVHPKDDVMWCRHALQQFVRLASMQPQKSALVVWIISKVQWTTIKYNYIQFIYLVGSFMFFRR